MLSVLMSPARPSVFVATAAALLVAGAPIPVSARSAPSNDGDPVLRELEALESRSSWRELAPRAEAELGARPESRATFDARNKLVSMGLVAYRSLAQDSADDCESVAAGIRVADRYLAQLEGAYGSTVQTDAVLGDAVAGVAELRAEFARLYTDRRCDQARTAEPPGQQNPPPRTDPVPSAQPPARPLVVGLGVAAGLTGTLLLISLGTGLSRYKEPFQGAAYLKIYDAAVASTSDSDPGNDVPHDGASDMCADPADRVVRDACDSWHRLGRIAVGTGVATGLLAATTAALAVLVTHKRRQYERAVALVRTHRPHLSASPGSRGGVHFTFGFRF